jgi:hypothetical protein
MRGLAGLVADLAEGLALADPLPLDAGLAFLPPDRDEVFVFFTFANRSKG